MKSRKDLFSFLAIVTVLVGVFWTIVAIVIFLVQSMMLKNDGVIEAFWFTFNSLLYSWGLCFLPLILIFFFLSYRNGIVSRQERQHAEQIDAIRGLSESLNQFQQGFAPSTPIPAKPSSIMAQSGFHPQKDDHAYMPPRYVPPMSPIIIDAPTHSEKHQKFKEPEPIQPLSPSYIDPKIFEPPTNTDEQKIARAGQLWRAGKISEAIKLLETMPKNPRAREILAKIRK